MDNLDIVVVANNKRPSLIVEYLKGVPHFKSITPDYPFPPGWAPDPDKADYCGKQIGAFRCFRGHQEALRHSSKDIVLVLEDDAVPNRNDWLSVIETSSKILPQYDIVSLHGREIAGIANRVPFEGLEFVELEPSEFRTAAGRIHRVKKAFGSLAYLIKRETIPKIINDHYNGLPMDLYLLNCFKACILSPSPFNHDRRFGTLIE